MCRKFNTCDSLLCVNVSIRDIVVCPFSTIFTTQMDWWQLINFDNPSHYNDESGWIQTLYIHYKIYGEIGGLQTPRIPLQENNTDVEVSVNVDPFKPCRTSVLLDLEVCGHGII